MIEKNVLNAIFTVHGNNAKYTVHRRDGIETVPCQNEVENIAILTMGTHESIYFDRVPVNKKLYLKYDHKINTWILHTIKEN